MKWYYKHVIYSLLCSLLVNSEGRQVRAEEAVHDDIAKLHNEFFSSKELPSFAWTGAYIGVNLGAGIPIHLNERLQAVQGSNPSQFDLIPPTAERAGITSGIQAGYNWQIGNFVYGVETDINFLNGRGGNSGLFIAPAAYLPLMVTAYALSYSSSANYFGSLRARLGVSFDRNLLYFTGGIATGGTRGAATLLLLPSGFSDPYYATDSGSSRSKYVIGAGLERSLGNSMSARFEYLFLNQALNSQYFFDSNYNAFISRTRNENHIMRLGINYSLGAENKFDDWEHPGAPETKDEELYSVHGLATNVVQGYPAFSAKYTGENSLPASGEIRVGTTDDVYLGSRLWKGASIFVNPELNYGYGLADGVGAASYPNAAYARGDSGSPYMRFQRYFVRQTIGLGGGQEAENAERGNVSEQLESSENQLSQSVDVDRLSFTAGKFAVGDIFDANIYAHDPTRDFLNFSFNSMGSFDFASDAWGYSYGAAAEWKQSWWTLRAGVFQLPDYPGSFDLETQFCRQCMGVGEAEARYELLGQPGIVKMLAYNNVGNIAKISEVNNIALANGNFPPDVSSLRNKHTKPGLSFSLAQQLYSGIGLFVRAGITDGRYETISYADVDKMISGGFVFSGEIWKRPNDEIGIASALGALQKDRQIYFTLGGSSIDIGDGMLNYNSEKTLEVFYRWTALDWLETTFDYQFISNPGYNSDRGPVNLFAVRTRARF